MKIQFVRDEKKPKEKKEKPVKEKKSKQKRVRIKKVGNRKISVVLLWCLFVFAFAFAIYKNFTAIDIRTETKETIIKEKTSDTNSVETFVENFAKIMYSWNPKNLSTRTESLKNYLSENLLKLNSEMVREDSITESQAENIHIWNVEKINKNWFDVTISVLQKITEYPPVTVENENKDKASPAPEPTVYDVETSYIVNVYIDDLGNMIIPKNPIVTAKPQKAEEPKVLESDGSVNGDSIQEINKFLETFFMLYPNATEEELVYYVSDNVLKPIHKEYLFSGLSNQTYRSKDDIILVGVTVKYLDQETKCIQYLQYDLKLQKNHNWVIVGKGKE